MFLDRVDEHYPGVELVSRRDITVRDDAETAANHAFAEDLTDRQREVLRTAYERGFFQSPRATTGVELADILGVSQPTVTHHLREGQRRLFDALFESS
jgi:predicted DNA binding protein